MKYNHVKTGESSEKGISMADINSHGDPGSIWELVKNGFGYLASIVLALFAWAGKRQVSRIDDLDQRMDRTEASYISREEHNKTIEALRTDIRNASEGTHKRLDQLLLHIAKEKNH